MKKSSVRALVCKFAGLGAPLLLLAACSSSESLTQANADVEQFHERLNAQNYDAILDDADPLFYTGTTRSVWTSFFEAIHRKLGNARSSRQESWRVNTSTVGTLTTIDRSIQFERGSGEEEFVYRAVGNKLKLVAYHINSMQLIIS